MLPLARSSLLRAAPALRRSPAVGLGLRPHITPVVLQSFRIAARGAATTGKGTSTKKTPPSDSPMEDFLPAMSSARKEARAVAIDIAKTIAGSDPAGVTRETHAAAASGVGGAEPMVEDFASITSSIAAEVPKPVLYTGLAGALPYLGTTAATIYYARQAGIAYSAGATSSITPEDAMAVLNACTHIQVTYGAVLLSFLGALHWGMEFVQYGGEKGYPRLLLGAAPVVFAWSTLAFEPTMALATQWLGFTALWYADLQATNYGWTPRWYSQYRFYLSILIGTCMITTLGAVNFFGAWTGASEHAQARDKLAEKTRNLPGRIEGEYEGDIEAIDGDVEMSDNYVVIRKRAEPEAAEEEEGGEEGEGEAKEGEGEGGEEGDDPSKKGQQDAPAGEKEQKQAEKDRDQAASAPGNMKQDSQK